MKNSVKVRDSSTDVHQRKNEKSSKTAGLHQSEYVIDDDEHENEKKYEPGLSEKIINYLLCRRDLAHQKLSTKPVSLFGLFRFGKMFDHFLMIVGILCAVTSGVAQPILATINGRITNVLLLEEPSSPEFRKKAYENVYIFIGLGVFLAMINYLQYMCFQTACCRIIAKMRHNYVKSILRQNAGWFDHNQSGELTTRLNDNMERIREGIGDKLGLLIRGFAMFITAIIVAFIYEWRVALMMFGVAPITCLIMTQLSKQMGAMTRRELEGVAKAGAIAEESVLGVRTVQAFNGQDEMVHRYKAALSRGKKFGVQKSLWSGFLGGLFFLVLLLFLGGGLYYGGYLLKVGVFKKPGDVFVVVFSMLLGAYFLGLVSPHLMVLLNARVAAATIYQTIDRIPHIDVYSKCGSRPSKVEGRVVFSNVHFRYPTRKDVKVLNGLDLVIEPGQTVAFVGHSGCGKSTSVGLLTRLYEAESGKVTIDGHDVRDMNIEWLRNVIGIVQQEPVLFNDTIVANLREGKPDADMDLLIKVCQMANAHDFITKLPQGYQTRIGDGGVQLSGGQKQRIAIARTLVRDPKVLLLDEATSALDAQSEAIVQEALNNASKGRSTIIIAHRLSTVRSADKIAVFDKGQIAEIGNHEELVKLGGRYADLVKAQQFRGGDEDEEKEDEEVKEGLTEINQHFFTDSYYGQGAASFTRATSRNDSFLRSAHRPSAVGAEALNADYELYPASAEQEIVDEDKITAGFITIYRNAKGNYLYMIVGLVFAILCGLHLPALSLMFSYVFRAISTNSYDDEMTRKLGYAFAMHAGVGLAILITQFASTALFGIASENMAMSFRCRAFRNILMQDAAYFDSPQHTPGKLITRLASDAPNVKAVIDARMLQVIYGITALLTNTIIGLMYCWQVALIGTAFSLMLGAAQIFLAGWAQKKNFSLVKNDDAGRLAIEIIENVRTIQLLTREEEFYKKYEFASKKQKLSEIGKCWVEAVNFAISQTFQYFMNTFTYSVGIHIISQETADVDDVFNTIVSMLLGAVAVMHSATYFPEFVKARTAAGMLFAMIERKPKTGNGKEGEKMELRGNVQLNDIKFAYPQRPHQPIMKGLQFTANKGQTVALVGPSGSGKSTVISLLERFYDPTDGAVRYDGKDVRQLSLYHLRTQVALVGQEPRLFAGTIRENICFGLEEEVSHERIMAAVELANAKNFIDGLPQGLDTEVGEKGTQLSGGQKQRVAIARAIVRNPKILLLDEATSALDSEAEKAVQEALDRARAGRTCITIAHRLSSIQNSDLIFYIENGAVQESGTHSSLIAKKGLYYALIKKQHL